MIDQLWNTLIWSTMQSNVPCLSSPNHMTSGEYYVTIYCTYKLLQEELVWPSLYKSHRRTGHNSCNHAAGKKSGCRILSCMWSLIQVRSRSKTKHKLGSGLHITCSLMPKPLLKINVSERGLGTRLGYVYGWKKRPYFSLQQLCKWNTTFSAETCV